MRARWGAAIAAAALAGSAGLQADEGVCQLPQADRRRTVSRDCMVCHDGSAGSEIPFRMGADDRGMSHPVTVDYAAAAAAHPDRYAPPEALPPEVPLVAGKVECTTCHDPASPDTRRVAAVRDLCLACHRM